MHDYFVKENDNLEHMIIKLQALQAQHEMLKKESKANEELVFTKSDELIQMHQRLADHAERVSNLEDDVQAQRIERASFELLYTELEVLTKELKAMTDKYQRAKQESEKWRKRALKLKQLDENTTPRTLQVLLQSRDEIVQSERNVYDDKNSNVR